MIDQLPLVDTVWGIDRYVTSAARGQLAVPVIYLWKQPGSAIHKDNLTGAVAHATQVTVTRHKLHQNEMWFFVKCDVRHKGKIYPQRGWCKANLLLTLGDRHVDWGEGLQSSDAAAMPFQQNIRGQV